MKKTLKWSVLLTFALGIFWLFYPPKDSTVFNFTIGTLNISSLFSTSMFWSLLIITPIFLLVCKLSDNDMSFNPGIGIISILSAFFFYAFGVGEMSLVMIFSIIGFFSLIVFLMVISDSKLLLIVIIKRLLISTLLILFINSLLYGISNGLLMALIFLILYLLFLIILLFGIIVYKIKNKK